MGNTPQPIQLDTSTFMPLDPATQPRQRSGIPASSSPASVASTITPGADYSHVQLDPSTFSPVAGGGAGASHQTPHGPTISAPPKSSDLVMPDMVTPGGVPLPSRLTTPLARKLMDALDKLREVENFTREGRAAHPIQAHIGDMANRLEGLLFGTETHKEDAIGSGKYGMLTNPVMAALIPGAEGEPAAAAAIRGGANLVKGGYQAVKEAVSGGKAAEEAPGIVKQIVRGEKVAQAPAQKALRTGAQEAGQDESIAHNIAQNPSIRTSLEEPIEAIEGRAKDAYKAIDKATGGKFQPNADRLANVNNKLRDIAGTDEAKEAELTASKQRLEWQQEQLFDKAAENGIPRDIVQSAKADFKQAQALRDLETKVFKNPSVIEGNAAMGASETVNVKATVKALQKLQDSTEFGGPRLEQALGKDGAQALLKDMYAAQKAGVTAMTRQQFAVKLAKYSAWGSVLLGGAGAVRHAVQAVGE